MCENVAKAVPLPLLMDELSPSGNHTARDLDVIYQGDYRRHPVRRALRKRFKDTFTFLTRSPDWKDVMERANFTLCPRGYGETSYRLAESIMLGSVPIYVWKGLKWLPYQELVDWDQFSISVNAKRLEGLPDMVQLARQRLPAMQKRMREVKHMFTYDYACNYVERTVAGIVV